jgi:hypothetical protein
MLPPVCQLIYTSMSGRPYLSLWIRVRNSCHPNRGLRFGRPTELSIRVSLRTADVLPVSEYLSHHGKQKVDKDDEP